MSLNYNILWIYTQYEEKNNTNILNSRDSKVGDIYNRLHSVVEHDAKKKYFSILSVKTWYRQ
jgi:hypothetical protein